MQIIPKPERALPAHARVPGGRYVTEAGQDVTGATVRHASIVANDNGHPSFTAEPDPGASPALQSGPLVRINMFRRTAGWRPRDPATVLPDTLVSVETRGGHLYALEARAETLTLASYPRARTEPRLRPTTRGAVIPGKVLGHIEVRGKSHPVFDTLEILSCAS